MSGPWLVQWRENIEHNTDPQRRCYHGVHAKSEWRWTKWRTLGELPTKEQAEDSANSWIKLNKNTIRRLEYRVVHREDV